MNIKFWRKQSAPAPAPTANAARYVQMGGDTMQKYNQYFTERTLTPASIQSAIDIYRSEGKVQYLGNIMDLLLDSDDNLQSKILVRTSPLKKATWSYGVKLPKERIKFYDELIKRNLSEWIDIYIEGKLKGWQFQQVKYEFDGTLYRPTEMVTYSNLDIRVRNRRLGLYENDRPVELPDYQFISLLYRRPTLHTLLKYYVFYIYAINHWAQFVETYGKPPRIGKYDSLSLPAEIDVLKKAVKGLGTDQSCIISKEMDIEFKDYSGKYSSQSLYKTLCDFVLGRVTNAILGQPLTTQVGDVGSYALGQVQDQVQDHIVESDIKDLSNFVNILLKYVDEVNFAGTGVDVEFAVFKPVNLEQRIKIDTAVVALGVPVAKSYFYDTYNLPVPKPGEEVVSRMPEVESPKDGVDNVDEEDKEKNPNTEHAEDTEILTQRKAEESREKQSADECNIITNAAIEDEIAKSLAKMQGNIRACENLKELKELDYWWFVRDIAGDFAKNLAESYVNGRKSGRKQGKKANTALPTIRFEFDDRSIQTINAFRNQAHVISAVRVGQAFKQLWDDAAKILEEGGDFKDFIAQATLSGFAPDNPYHLKTEYETAIAGAQSAGHWAEIEADADLFPYLRYVTMQDNLVREEHQVLDGTVAAVDDPFWDENYPPNGYNCRCSVEQVTDAEAKADPKWNGSKPTITKDANFNQNTGKTDKLPSDAFDKLWEFAQIAIDQLPNAERLVNADGKPKIVYDINNYPVDMGASKDNAVAMDAITEPTEIWHNSEFETAYLKRLKDKVVIAKTEKGKLYWVWELDDYQNQGRYGVMEYGQV